jgi:phage baseplate assembly protein W
MAVNLNTEVALVLPFMVDGNGNIITTNNQNQIWSNRVKTLIGTRLGERVMRPEYGAKIGESLFNTVGSMSDIVTREVNRVFQEYLPLLTVSDISIDHNTNTNELRIDISYQLPNTSTTTTQVGVMVVSNINPPYEELS